LVDSPEASSEMSMSARAALGGAATVPSEQPHIVFLAHQLERTGAALLLLQCVERIAVERDWRLTVIARQPGPLGPAFAGCCRVIYLTPPALAPLGGLAHRLGLGRWWRRAVLACRAPRRLDPDLVYSNTITNDLEMRRLTPPGVPVITHAHELSTESAGIRPGDLDSVTARTDRFVAVSSGVATMLCAYGVRSGDIAVIPPGIQSPNAHGCLPSQPSPSYLPDTDTRFVVGGCGGARAAKGIDLFLDLAETLLEMREDVTLRWLGAGIGDLRQTGLARRARRLGSRVQFIPAVDDVEPFYRSLDIFALTSRIDPFPLVMIEAAARELPLVAFAGSGGADDFLAAAAQPLIAGWSATAMADIVCTLLDDPPARARLGRRANDVANTYTLARTCGGISTEIEELLGDAWKTRANGRCRPRGSAAKRCDPTA
jgi:glycosyltransferase involved in cell wall biosynthesis